jgi:leucyl-tRNA synthetase
MIAALMEYSNYLGQAKGTAVAAHPAWKEAIQTLVLLVAPAFPHIAEELWKALGGSYSVHQQAWPTWDEELAAEEVLTIVVQVNGRLRDKFDAPADVMEEDAKAQALACSGVQRHMQGKSPFKVIYVPGKLVNIVVK